MDWLLGMSDTGGSPYEWAKEPSGPGKVILYGETGWGGEIVIEGYGDNVSVPLHTEVVTLKPAGVLH